MTKKIVREIPFLLIISLPILLLMWLWESIPPRIPLHYNWYLVPDRWGSKQTLWGIVVFVPILQYVLLLIAKYVDPKKRISQMGSRFYTVRFIMGLILAAVLVLLIIGTARDFGFFRDNLFVVVGLIFICLGNYFRNMKPNYFIGFRTPWALEDDDNWRITHRRGSAAWFAGGIGMVLINLWELPDYSIPINYFIVLTLVAVPFIVSYRTYRKATTDN